MENINTMNDEEFVASLALDIVNDASFMTGPSLPPSPTSKSTKQDESFMVQIEGQIDQIEGVPDCAEHKNKKTKTTKRKANRKRTIPNNEGLKKPILCISRKQSQCSHEYVTISIHVEKRCIFITQCKHCRHQKR